MNIRESFDIYFDLVEVPRSQAHITYKLSDVLFILITGILCSCIDLEMIIEFAEEKEKFLKQYTELQSIPCLSTISNTSTTDFHRLTKQHARRTKKINQIFF